MSRLCRANLANEPERGCAESQPQHFAFEHQSDLCCISIFRLLRLVFDTVALPRLIEVEHCRHARKLLLSAVVVKTHIHEVVHREDFVGNGRTISP